MNQDEIKKIINDIFTLIDCSISKCEFTDENGMLWCTIETPDSRLVIGRDGETLKSLNHLIKKIIEKIEGEEKSTDIFIDINGYQKKHFDNLKNIAHMMAERARYFKSNIEIDPMPAYDRRIVHMFLEGAKDLKTESEGSGSNRRIIIKYVNENKI
ncbi:MAG TPA: R3H domain-containing nucleic acid-binding protein [Candidatus Paceibacterota bacterium]|nr:R3H domain-containing nucleic acid-binding protein [Candidatus Paceibacterota bacterium]